MIAAFAALTVALALLWAPRLIDARHASTLWIHPFALSLVFAVASTLVDLRGLVALLLFAVACLWANRASGRVLRPFAHAIMLLMCAGLLLHVIPGFANPRVLDDVVVGTTGVPYSKYLNFDKGAAGLMLLGIYAPDRARRDEGFAAGIGLLWRFVACSAIVMVLALVSGYVRWDPKLPSWWPLWLWSMVFLTALPEEAVFRGVAQDGIRGWLPPTERATASATLLAGTLFGVAHAGGGAAYVVLSVVAGIGYGWVYAASRSIIAATLAHTALNAVHLFFFSYPSLDTSQL